MPPAVKIRPRQRAGAVYSAGSSTPQAPAPADGPSMSVSFSCVLSQIDEIAAACEQRRPGSVTGPRVTPWNSREVEVVTPEGVRVVLTAARPLDPNGPQAEGLRRIGIEAPEA